MTRFFVSDEQLKIRWMLKGYVELGSLVPKLYAASLLRGYVYIFTPQSCDISAPFCGVNSELMQIRTSGKP